jgi:hypothetical protein
MKFASLQKCELACKCLHKHARRVSSGSPHGLGSIGGVPRLTFSFSSFYFALFVRFLIEKA